MRLAVVRLNLRRKKSANSFKSCLTHLQLIVFFKLNMKALAKTVQDRRLNITIGSKHRMEGYQKLSQVVEVLQMMVFSVSGV
ncbi:hypothetical protein C4J81_10320 [Deltaproteobacteria bacterium Smac51]|nr:hypothetical protein C4J81_10320 [Deltaproteobacteria bacterium Smac51]